MKTPLTSIEEVLKEVHTQRPNADEQLIRNAYEFAKKAHEGQKRASGEDYIFHSLETARQLAYWGMDIETISAGLLHDVPEDTQTSLSDIQKNFGVGIAKLVEGITKLGALKYRGRGEQNKYVENLRKMFLAMAEDIRVIIIKFADRVHNLQTLQALPEKKQYRIALESMEIFAPIANRLGMWDVKGQIEDLAFQYVLPEEYQWITRKIARPLETKKIYLEKIQKKLETIFKEKNIKYRVIHGRTKGLFRTYKKALRKNRDITKIYDLVALRIVVEEVAQCYSILGVIHEYWKPLKGRIKDYIAQPKPNLYQSLHTTVFCDLGEIVEFQIRTKKMHDEAEFGIAAHWRYSEHEKVSPRWIKKQLSWMDELVKLQKEIQSDESFLESVKTNIFKDHIFVFTPMGDVIDLPEGATHIDFAYQIHTDVGDKCCGVKINDKIESLKTRLKSGDVVEIFTDKNRKLPSPDWLNFVITNSARNHIKSALKKDERQKFEL